MARGTPRYRRFDAESNSTATPSRLLLALFIVSLLMSLPLALNIVGRIQAEARMRAEFDRLAVEVQDGEHCLAQLSEAVEYAKTDAYVERWARERERLGKEGETVIVPASSQTGVSPARPWWEEQVDCHKK
jgi:hypothetical protein